MIGVRLEADLENRLGELAKKTGRTKSFYIREAIKNFLEDHEDYLLGIDVLEKIRSGEKTISLDDLEKELGLEN